MVCVRFAPSPTGFLHVGNIRTCLINYFYAKKYHGTFLLRIDDTDFERSKDEYRLALFDDLKWLSIEADDTFNQSGRIDRYDEVKKHLIEAGYLYPCYETSEELELKRKLQLTQGKPPVYDRSALHYTRDDIEKFEQENRIPHYRFKLPDDVVVWKDLVRGKTVFQPRTMSDPILIREDGSYLYSLPSVIDDIDYDVTHIFRGEDHISNTAVQIPIFQAVAHVLGKKFHMEFGHTSFLVGSDGEKLSKRTGSIAIRDLRNEEIEPMAIMSFLAYAGTSRPIKVHDTVKDLIGDFCVAEYGGSSPRFDRHQVDLLNERLFHSVTLDWVHHTIRKTLLTEDQWDVIKHNIETRSDIAVWENIFSGIIESVDIDPDFKKVAAETCPQYPFDENSWHNWTSAIKEKTGLKGKGLYVPLRRLLTGMDHGPEMRLLLPLLSPEHIDRLVRQ